MQELGDKTDSMRQSSCESQTERQPTSAQEASDVKLATEESRSKAEYVNSIQPAQEQNQPSPHNFSENSYRASEQNNNRQPE